jgi:O-antigen/teichoic acid export membrane protein
MTVLRRNIAANFVGGLWTGLMGLVFVPLYIRLLGIEAYGLVSIFATLLAIFALLDMGLSITLNREMARLAVRADENAQEMKDILRTLEIPYGLLAVVIGIVICVLAPFIAYHWVNVESISPHTVQMAIMLMGLAAALQLPIGFYTGGLLGLQLQGTVNLINAVMATVRGLGAVTVLWLVSPTVGAYFTWQIVVSSVQLGLFIIVLRRSLPRAGGASRFRRELLSKIWRFAAGMTGIMLTSTLLTQMDKVVLSRLLSLKVFGYYALASLVAMSLYRFITPVFTATFPRMTHLVESGATDEIVTLYHKSSQLAALLLIPIAVSLSLFSKEILLLWTQNAETATNTYPLMSILVLGTAFHGLAHVPYALQLAFGWARLNLTINTVLTVLLVPLMVVLTRWYGAMGAASVWLILFVGYMIASTWLMHRRVLTAEKWRWYFEDIARPLLAAVAVGTIGRFIIRSDWPPVPLIAALGLVTVGAFAASAAVANRLDAFSRCRSFVAEVRLRALGARKTP